MTALGANDKAAPSTAANDDTMGVDDDDDGEGEGGSKKNSSFHGQDQLRILQKRLDDATATYNKAVAVSIDLHNRKKQQTNDLNVQIALVQNIERQITRRSMNGNINIATILMTERMKETALRQGLTEHGIKVNAANEEMEKAWTQKSKLEVELHNLTAGGGGVEDGSRSQNLEPATSRRADPSPATSVHRAEAPVAQVSAARAATVKSESSVNKIRLVFPFDAEKKTFEDACRDLRELGGKVPVVLEDGLKWGAAISTSEDDGDGGFSSAASAPLKSAPPISSTRTHFMTIREYEMKRLEQGEFLNDTLIDFFMRW